MMDNTMTLLHPIIAQSTFTTGTILSTCVNGHLENTHIYIWTKWKLLENMNIWKTCIFTIGKHERMGNVCQFALVIHLQCVNLILGNMHMSIQTTCVNLHLEILQMNMDNMCKFTLGKSCVNLHMENMHMDTCVNLRLENIHFYMKNMYVDK